MRTALSLPPGIADTLTKSFVRDRSPHLWVVAWISVIRVRAVGTANEKRADSFHQLATAGYDRHNTFAVRIYGVLCFSSTNGTGAFKRT
jgi:hypothetical protein